ncbi:MAG TPA: DsbA family protein [Gemmatimonadales bacterium]|nr:DsbA family protein [Gemmatimonadales bacterium]
MTSQLTPPVGAYDHAMGPDDAPLTLVEYGDYECPHCGMAHPIVKTVQRRFGDRLRFVFRHFPITQIHPHAEDAAEMAEIAGSQGAFWAMHDLLYENQHALADEDLIGYAAQLGLDATWAASMLASHSFAPKVREDFLSGVRSGVNGTPTFFINGIRHDGPWDAPGLADALDHTLHAGVR